MLLSEAVSKIKPGDLIRLRWEDSAAPVGGEWIQRDDADDYEATMVTSIGEVLKINDKYITLASHLADTGCVLGLISIPTSAFRELDFLKSTRKSSHLIVMD